MDSPESFHLAGQLLETATPYEPGLILKVVQVDLLVQQPLYKPGQDTPHQDGVQGVADVQVRQWIL